MIFINVKSKKGPDKRIIVTSALPYVNSIPHLGNAVNVLSGDVFHRFLKLRGLDTVFICGTDEHGTRTEIEAKKRGVSEDKHCKVMHDMMEDAFGWLNIEFSNFGRTSKKENHELTQMFFKNLDKMGYIIEKEIELLYCPKDKMYLPDSYVEGNCPHCGAEDVKGDQCDVCGKLLNPAELKSPHCKMCGTEPEVRKDKHLFLDLKKISPKLKKWLNGNKHWSGIIKNLPLGWIKEGLEPRCITRNMHWGVKVPKKGYEDKVFYVWFDAPIGYISSTIEWAKKTHGEHSKNQVKDAWESWWKDGKARVYHFMGKDNVPFHSIIWPATLIEAKGWNLPHMIVSNEYLNYEGGKFSKSKGRGVFLDDIQETGVAPDVWRYYVMSVTSPVKDYDFSWKDMQERVNGELVGNLGNFVNRAISFGEKNFGSVPKVKLDKSEEKVIEKAKKLMEKMSKDMEKPKFKEAMQHMLAISDMGNKYFQENEPWKLLKGNPKEHVKGAHVVRVCLELTNLLCQAMWPFMPNAAEETWKLLGNTGHPQDAEWGKVKHLKSGQKLSKPKILFSKIDDKQVKGFEEMFSGKRGGNESKPEDFANLNLRVARILTVEPHPDADKLYVLTLDVGDIAPRQLVAGLRSYYGVDELKGRNVIIVANLKPAKLRGVTSQGMMLAAEDKKNVGLLMVPNSSPGDRVEAEGIKSAPKKELEFEEFLKAKMVVKDKGVYFGNHKLKTKKEDVRAEKVKDGAKVC